MGFIMRKIIFLLRTFYTVGIIAGMLSGFISSILFLLAFILGGSTTVLSQWGLVLMEAMIPVAAISIICGVIIIYIDPNEKHSFSIDQPECE